MPRQYRRSRSRRRTSTPWYRRKYNAMQLASKAWRATRYIRGLVNSEMLHNQGNSSISLSTSGTVIPLTSIAQGDTASGRTGNSILVRNVMIRIASAMHASATNTFFRFMLVQDMQQQGDTTPAVTDILESSTYLSPLATANVGRFKVLWSKTLKSTAAGSTSLLIDKYWKVYSHVRYNGTASTDINKNGYYLLMLSSEAANTPTVVYQFKVGYHDN